MVTTHDVQKNWTEIKAQISAKWSKFNDLELEGFKANLDKLADQIQKTYGVAKHQAEKEYAEFKKSILKLTPMPPANTTASKGSRPTKSQAV